MQVKRRKSGTQKLAATTDRNFRTFLLVSQFEAQEIGARIRLARKERGMTQEQLASVASFSKRSLQDYEGGVTIPYPHLRELSALLNKPSEWFLYGDEADPEPSVLATQVAELQTRVEEILRLLRENSEAPPETD